MVFKSRLPEVKPDAKYNDLVSNFFWHQLDKFQEKVLLVDHESGRQWTGGQLKSASARLARALIANGMSANQDCVTFYKHDGYTHLVALALIFAGCSVCVGNDLDPEHEHAHMLGLMQPAFVFVAHHLVDEMLRLRASSTLGDFKVVVMDDDRLEAAAFEEMSARAGESGLVLGLHRHLLAATGKLESSQPGPPSPSLPVQVKPERPTFVLLTSGSTGRPKPVGRSQRNSLHVCHSLVGAQDLWDLNESSVVWGHLPLDHGTGIFQFKQCLARGFKLVVANGYQFETTLQAIRRHRISDIVLGSALVHNFVSSREVADLLAREPAHFESLRNFIAVGSSIANHSVVRQFMSRLPQCSVRQAYGMTECGFLSVVPRELSLRDEEADTCIKGPLLPNVEIKLIGRQHQQAGGSGGGVNSASSSNSPPVGTEITQFDQVGELYIRAPTVSAGYMGVQFDEQTRANFLADGFYKSNDMCSVSSDGLLRVFGRFSEILCLDDGWKVLPAEIEQVILEHPLVREAAVIGVPHPKLPTCHAPRAYIVPHTGIEVLADDDGVANHQQAGQHEEHNTNGNGKTNGHQPRPINGGGGVNATNGTNGLLNGTAKKEFISRRLVYDFVAERLSGPKHLIGGIKFMEQLPKISIGKVDKKLLRQMDGFTV